MCGMSKTWSVLTTDDNADKTGFYLTTSTKYDEFCLCQQGDLKLLASVMNSMDGQQLIK